MLRLDSAKKSLIKGITVPGETQQMIPIKIGTKKLEQYIWKLEEPTTLYELRDDLIDLRDELEEKDMLFDHSWQFILKYRDAGYRSSKVQNIEDVFGQFVLDNLDYTSADIDANMEEAIGQYEDEIIEITLVKYPKMLGTAQV
jgi:hypothetical protein